METAPQVTINKKDFSRYVGATVVGGKKYLKKRNWVFNKLIYEEKMNDLLDDLEKNYEGLKEEFYGVIKEDDYTGYPLRNLYEFGWRVIGVKYSGLNNFKNHEKFPILSSITKKYDHITRLSGYSKLEPGAKIGSHCDSPEEVTVHLGITIPEGNCGFRMFDATTRLQEGKTQFFYSNDSHEAWNLTDKDRIILIFDLKNMSFSEKILHYLINIKPIANFLNRIFWWLERKKDLKKIRNWKKKNKKIKI